MPRSFKNPFASQSSSKENRTRENDPEKEKKSASEDASPFAKPSEKTKSSSAKKSPFSLDLAEPSEGFLPDEVVPPKQQKGSEPSGARQRAAELRKDPFAPPTRTKSKSKTKIARRKIPVIKKIDPAKVKRTVMSSAPISPPAMETETSPFQEPQKARVTPPKLPDSKPAPVTTSGPPQLVLRALFGVSEVLDRDEILDKARQLSGIKNLQIVEPQEAAAISSLKERLERLGFGEGVNLSLTTTEGNIDLVEESGTTLAVMREGDYEAGVMETLIIVAREISLLG